MLLLRSLWGLASTAGLPSMSNCRHSNPTHHRIKRRSIMGGVDVDSDLYLLPIAVNFSDLPDECLARIFKSMGSSLDLETCSLVCRRWLRVENQNRHCLFLEVEGPERPKPDLIPLIPSLFTRYDALTTLALKCSIPYGPVLIGNDALILISLHCRNLTRLKLLACDELIDEAMTAFALNCKGLKELNCDYCNFGAKGINAFLDHSSSLENLSLKRIKGLTDSSAAMPIGPGVAAKSLKKICIEKVLCQCFGPLIIGSKKLRTLEISNCYSRNRWDELLKAIVEEVTGGLVEIYMKSLVVTDVGLFSISNCCSNLEILHLDKMLEFTNWGLVSIANHCRRLRELHIRGRKVNINIGDEGLIAIAKGCPNLEELVLCGINFTYLSLSLLATNCQNLERLAVGWSNTFGDAEISCIADKCIALKNLDIKECPITTNHVMEALPGRCSNLVQVKIRNCSGMSCDGVVSKVCCDN
ncbi:F-box protein At1g47056-like [Telopea speciosissima]|uniref:F-box protein At1g47056-like n=1 Tax=Telopea speciosissima TaxID=54955 RepID=UPI001CC64D7B|nr:F-box protein At1g47056-like [Telopea speciosissima]